MLRISTLRSRVVLLIVLAAALSAITPQLLTRIRYWTTLSASSQLTVPDVSTLVRADRATATSYIEAGSVQFGVSSSSVDMRNKADIQADHWRASIVESELNANAISLQEHFSIHTRQLPSPGAWIESDELVSIQKASQLKEAVVDPDVVATAYRQEKGLEAQLLLERGFATILWQFESKQGALAFAAADESEASINSVRTDAIQAWNTLGIVNSSPNEINEQTSK